MKNKILVAIIVILSIETVVISIINKSIKDKLKIYEQYLNKPDENRLLPKNIISDIILTNVQDGIEKSLKEIINSKGGILFIFTTDCPSCDEISDTWNEINKKNKERNAVIGISTNNIKETEDYIRRNRIEYSVYLMKRSSDKYIFTSFPNTVVVDKNGIILKSIYGISKELNKI